MSCHIHVDYNSSAGYGTWLLRIHDVVNIELNAKCVSSDPFQVCPHEDVQHVTSHLFRQGYPGELLRIPVVTVGLNKWSFPAVIREFFIDTHGNTSLAHFQDIHKVKKTCTVLYYQVHSSIVNNSAVMQLYWDAADQIHCNVSCIR